MQFYAYLLPSLIPWRTARVLQLSAALSAKEPPCQEQLLF